MGAYPRVGTCPGYYGKSYGTLERLYRIVLNLGSEWFWNGEWSMDIVRALTDSLPSPPVVPTVENPLAWLESSHTYQRGSILINLMMCKLVKSNVKGSQ